MWLTFLSLRRPVTLSMALASVVLLGAGMALMIATMAARQLPILAALGAAVVALTACGLRFYLEGTVDASRVLALSATMLILWLALQHRRAVRPTVED